MRSHTHIGRHLGSLSAVPSEVTGGVRHVALVSCDISSLEGIDMVRCYCLIISVRAVRAFDVHRARSFRAC